MSRFEFNARATAHKYLWRFDNENESDNHFMVSQCGDALIWHSFIIYLVFSHWCVVAHFFPSFSCCWFFLSFFCFISDFFLFVCHLSMYFIPFHFHKSWDMIEFPGQKNCKPKHNNYSLKYMYHLGLFIFILQIICLLFFLFLSPSLSFPLSRRSHCCCCVIIKEQMSWNLKRNIAAECLIAIIYVH